MFTLTRTKAEFWDRKGPDPSIDAEYGTMEYYCKLLRKAGYLVSDPDGGNFVRVDTSAGNVWEALSGQPSDPERAAHYDETRKGWLWRQRI